MVAIATGDACSDAMKSLGCIGQRLAPMCCLPQRLFSFSENYEHIISVHSSTKTFMDCDSWFRRFYGWLFWPDDIRSRSKPGPPCGNSYIRARWGRPRAILLCSFHNLKNPNQCFLGSGLTIDLLWADLMRRAFDLDALPCHRWGPSPGVTYENRLGVRVLGSGLRID